MVPSQRASALQPRPTCRCRAGPPGACVWPSRAAGPRGLRGAHTVARPQASTARRFQCRRGRLIPPQPCGEHVVWLGVLSNRKGSVSGLDCSTTSSGFGAGRRAGDIHQGQEGWKTLWGVPGAQHSPGGGVPLGGPWGAPLRGAVPVGVATALHKAAGPASRLPSSPEQASRTEAASVCLLI